MALFRRVEQVDARRWDRHERNAGKLGGEDGSPEPAVDRNWTCFDTASPKRADGAAPVHCFYLRFLNNSDDFR